MNFQAYVTFLGEIVTMHARQIGLMTVDKVSVTISSGLFFVDWISDGTLSPRIPSII